MQKRYWLRGGVTGLVLFCLVFVFMSLKNTGKISVSDAFSCSSGHGPCLVIINYGLVFFFILVGSFLGWLYGKIKNRNKMVS